MKKILFIFLSSLIILFNSATYSVCKELLIAFSSMIEQSPAVAYNTFSEEYLIAYFRSFLVSKPPIDPVYQSELWVQRLSDKGDRIGSSRKIYTGQHSWRYAPSLNIEFASYWNSYLLVWTFQEAGSSYYKTFTQNLSISGRPQGAIHTLQFRRSGQPFKAPKIKYNYKNRHFAMVWDGSYGGKQCVFSSKLSVGGYQDPTSKENVVIQIDNTDQWSPDIDYYPSMNQYLVSWREQYRGGYLAIYVRKLDAIARPIGSDKLIASIGRHIGNGPYFLKMTPAIACDKFGRSIIAWEYNGTVYGRRLDDSLNYIDQTPFVIFQNGYSPEVAYDPVWNSVMVVADQPAGIFKKNIVGALVYGSGSYAPFMHQIQISQEPNAYDDETKPTILYTEGKYSYISIWQNLFAGDDMDIHGRILSDIGELQ